MLFAVKLSMTFGPSVSRDYYCTTCREYWNIDAALAVHLFTPWHGVCVFTRIYTHTSSSDPKVAYTNFSLPIHALEQSELDHIYWSTCDHRINALMSDIGLIMAGKSSLVCRIDRAFTYTHRKSIA